MGSSGRQQAGRLRNKHSDTHCTESRPEPGENFWTQELSDRKCQTVGIVISEMNTLPAN